MLSLGWISEQAIIRSEFDYTTTKRYDFFVAHGHTAINSCPRLAGKQAMEAPVVPFVGVTGVFSFSHGCLLETSFQRRTLRSASFDAGISRLRSDYRGDRDPRNGHSSRYHGSLERDDL